MVILDAKTAPINQIIAQTVEVLASGGVVVYPTETVYGIGVDATNQGAVDKLLQYKSRREGKPMSVAVCGIEMAEKYVDVNSTARNLYTNFLPGPLTVISKSKGKVAKGVESELGTLGVRILDYDLIREIIRKFGKPITATSANASYKKRPYSIDDIFDSISEKQKSLIDLVIDAGTLLKRDPSTVVDTTLNQELVLRQGSLKLTDVLERDTKCAEETQLLGQQLMKRYQPHLGYKSVIFALQGEMGAGKTEMTKGIARELNIKEAIQSPTFIIEREYPIPTVEGSFVSEIKPRLFHIDTWRLVEPSEIEQLGFFDKVAQGNVFVIEWADRIQNLLERLTDDSAIVWVKIEYGNQEDSRKIMVSDFN